jgi:predicted nuclease of predicted toxin-antitoxin system
MRLLFDANLSPRVAERLRQAGHDAAHVADHGLLRASDEEIAEFAAASGHTVVTADSDFPTNLALGGHVAPSVVLFRSGDGLSPAEQAALLESNLGAVAEALNAGAVVSIRRGRLRLRRLPLR